MNPFGFLNLRQWLLAFALLVVCQPAFAAKRVALVIGNSAYQSVPALPNPANDAVTIAQTFRDAGFDVVDSRHDLSSLDMKRALRDFSDKARDADIAVVYYAGHGMEMDGNNYLIPVDARLERDFDVEDESVSLDRVLLAVDPARQLRLVILDACRDNPFARKMKRTVANRGIGRGLAKIEPTSPNMLIAYSAKAGSTAVDGDAKNSPFTLALAKYLTRPGLDVRKAFGFVRDDVLKSTSNQQEPFVYGSLGGEDVALVPAKSAPAAAPVAAAASPQADVRKDYELALQVGNKAAWQAFLAQYPNGFYANLARLQLDKITAEETRVAATEKAQSAEQERARLAAQGAQRERQAKADADAKAAEQARIAAEAAKQVAQEKATEASSRAADIAPAASLAAAPAPADKPVNVAALNPQPSQEDVTRSVQAELHRVGCLTGDADGDWGAASKRSLGLFNRYAGTKFDTGTASSDALDAIRLKTSRVCPLVCAHGFKADGDQCSRIACAEGSFLNDDNECEKRRGKPANTARRDNRQQQQDRPEPPPRATARSGGSGQIVCDAYLCRQVRRGCHLEYTGGAGPNGGNTEVCN